LRTTPTRALADRELRRSIANAFEEWVVERFGDVVRHAARAKSGRLEPDLVALFRDDEGNQQLLVGEILARRPLRRDVERLARMIERHGASLGLVVALDEPSPAVLSEIYRHGTTAISPGTHTPRIRVVTPRELARGDVDLLPAKKTPEILELRAA
jgi:hypothetical protein